MLKPIIHRQDKMSYYEYLPILVDIPGIGILNKHLSSYVREADVLIIGGYNHPSYLILAFLARLYNKPYILLFDGIAPSRLLKDKNASFNC